MNTYPTYRWQAQPTGKIKRPTIGFLTANIHIGAARALWPGVLDAAQAGDANLICYPGGRLHAAENFEAERNLIYQLINTEHLDGLVSWTSALAGTTSSQEVATFHQSYGSLPMVSLAYPLDHGSLVSIDGYQGMQALIFHLVDVHHYGRIALIRGPESHPYAQERYLAFLDALHAKGLSAEPALIASAASWEKGAEAMRILLDERHLQPGKDFQAVVAASDLLAIDALNMMAERGIRVPTDVAVAGFNDIEEGRLVRPPLTSVSLPFYEQGKRSVELLLNSLATQEVPEPVILQSQLLVRQSCGCPSRSVNQAVADLVVGEVREPQVAFRRAQEQLVEQIGRVIHKGGVAATWAKRLIDAFRSEISGQGNGRFRSTLDGMLQQGVLDGDETAVWQGAISVLRRELLPALDTPTQLRAEDLFSQARVVIGEAVQRAHIARQLQAAYQNAALRDIGQALITTFDIAKLADVLAEQLPNLGMKSCYLALYETPSGSIEWARMVLAYTDNQRINLGETGQRFPSRQVVPLRLLPARRYSLLVEPLFFQTDPIGFVVLEIGPRDGDIYEVLRAHISSALKGALLFREAHEARLAAERANQIKTRLLANVSHELRTPLNIIIGHTQRLLLSPPPGLTKDLEHIQHSAEHQLRIINDLLDLSRAEIQALDLYPILLEPKTLIEEAFVSLAKDAPGFVVWQLNLPDHLPIIEADPVRLQQILLNLLSNAARFTEQGSITLGAESTANQLHLWVADTGIGIPPEVIQRIYEPFFTHNQTGQPAGGIGLGLSITRHLVALHQGHLTVDTQPGQGCTFHVYFPLPDLGEYAVTLPETAESALWFISHNEKIPEEIALFSQNQHLAVLPLSPQNNWENILATRKPAAIAWDMINATSDDWLLIRRLHNHPQLNQVPFILYQQTAGKWPAGLTSLAVKPATSQALWETIRPAVAQETAGAVLIVDDDPQARNLACEAVNNGLPSYTVQTAENGEAGLAAMFSQPPNLVILDLMMPHMDGFEVLERMRADERTRHIPVIILSGRQLSLNDVKRLEHHAAVTLQSKGLFSANEMIAALHRSLFGSDTLPPQTSALAKRAVAYLHQNYGRSLTRWEIAAGVGVSEDYLSRVFNQELGISPWDYLNRYRIARARELLHQTHDSVSQIGRQVGFSDPAYFSRVFHRLTGLSPRAYREKQDK